nr:nuclear transport factor 2 family protein [Microvirga ossetica]
MADDEKAILHILRDQEAAIGRGDAEAAISALAADVVTYDLPPPLEYHGTGTPAVDGLREWFATWEDGVTVEMKDPQVLINGDLAVAFGLARMRAASRRVSARSTNGTVARSCFAVAMASGRSATSIVHSPCGWTEAELPQQIWYRERHAG